MSKNSFKPAIEESERFIVFLNKKFSLKLPDNYLITFSKTNKNTLGYFRNQECENRYTNTTQDLNNININTITIKKCNPYEVIAHELAHFINYNNGVSDCSSNSYHNKHFKKVAETLLLNVEKVKTGFSKTSETEEFNKMLKDFKTNKDVFNIFENEKKKKVGSRMCLYICSCGVKVRTASKIKELNAVCLDCDGEFVRVEE